MSTICAAFRCHYAASDPIPPSRTKVILLLEMLDVEFLLSSEAVEHSFIGSRLFLSYERRSCSCIC